MRKAYPVITFLFLITMLIAAARTLSAEERYWVPADPPKCHYVIDASFDMEAGTIAGEERVTLPNKSNKAISIVAFEWKINDATSIKVFVGGDQLNDLNSANGSPTESPLFYRLPEPIGPGEELELRVEFSEKWRINPENDEILTSGWWYPRLWWDDLPTHDSFAARLDVPDGWAVAIAGRLNEETGYYENASGRACGFYLGRGMKTASRESAGVLITAIYRDEGEKCALMCLETAADAVAFYKDWLGFYPFSFLYIVPGGPGAWGGYPMSTGIVVIHGEQVFDKAPELHWRWITAHEIGHQYWGEWVLEADDPDWLWIGMGIFADREYTLHAGMEIAEQTRMMSRFLEGIKENIDTTMDIPPAQYRRVTFDFNNVVTHGKGYSVISMLDEVLGRETFMKIYRRCLRDYGGRRLGYHEFWRVCEEESGENLAWFFEQWARTGRFLALEVVSKESVPKDDGYETTVVIRKVGRIGMPVPVKAVFADGSEQIARTCRNFDLCTLEFRSAAELKEIVIDPEHHFAIVDDPPAATAEDIEEMASNLGWTGEGDKALEIYGKAAGISVPNARTWRKLSLALYDGEHYAEAYESLKRTLEIDSGTYMTFICNVWMGHIKDLQGDREAALGHYRAALASGYDSSVMHSQYNMKIDKAWVEERLQTPFVRMDQ